MGRINIPEFTLEDVRVLESINQTELKNAIDFLRDYKEVMWRNNDTGELITTHELDQQRVCAQPLPEYPEQFMQIGKMFQKIVTDNKIFIDLHNEGFFTDGSLASLIIGTLFSPALICAFIADAYSKERFCDGLFGFGIENRLYLKALLHLDDCLAYYYFNHCSNLG